MQLRRTLPCAVCDSPSYLANIFQDFFLERVALIHQGIQATLSDLDLGALPWRPEELPAACSLTCFRLATHDDIRQLVSKAPTKSCELDSMPIWLLKQCGDGIIPSMNSIINMSLESGVVPGCFKKALVRPMLKKPSLDADCLKNYRPVSNLSFISKQTERLIAARLNEHMSQFELFEPLQSAYKARHSCETALIHVQNNILRAMARGRWASFFSSTCPPLLKLLIIKRCWTDCTQRLAWGALHWTGLSPTLWTDTRSCLFVVITQTHAC